MGAHEAVGAGDQAGAALVGRAELAAQLVELVRRTRWRYRRAASMQGNHSGRRSAVRSGVLTGLSTAAVSGSAAVAGALLSRKFGHGVETDGFFAAYAVYVVVVLVASALRVVVLPLFARAREAGALGGEVGSWGLALALPLAACWSSSRSPAPHAARRGPDRQRRRRRRSAAAAAAVARAGGRRAGLRRASARARSPPSTTTAPPRSATAPARSSASS